MDINCTIGLPYKCVSHDFAPYFAFLSEVLNNLNIFIRFLGSRKC